MLASPASIIAAFVFAHGSVIVPLLPEARPPPAQFGQFTTIESKVAPTPLSTISAQSRCAAHSCAYLAGPGHRVRTGGPPPGTARPGEPEGAPRRSLVQIL